MSKEVCWKEVVIWVGVDEGVVFGWIWCLGRGLGIERDSNKGYNWWR